VETYLASILFRRSYVAKIPGDIVWERAVNSKITQLEVREFQVSRLNLKYRLFRFLFTKSILRAKVVIVPSPLLFELCLSWGVPQQKIRLVFNSVDVDFYTSNNISEKTYDCIVVNRLVAWKNVDEVIRACHALNLSLVVVGDGPEMPALRQLAKELNSNVTFVGNRTKLELLTYLHSAKIYILNSTADATAYSMLEARSCGLVAVANIKTGASEVINHGIDGFLTQATTHSELENALTVLLEKNSSELETMGQNARSSTVQSFNQEINFSQILNILVKQDAE
jgi:glycosyltransferase involved in cell wall biosynthesis